MDWSDKKHDFCLQGAGSQQRELGVVAHRPEAIDHWARALYQRFGGPIAVCLEIAKGPLVHALQRYEFLVLFPVNPAMIAKYREAFVPSRAKDDPTDAEIALELLLRHREKLQPLKPQSAAMRALTTLVEQRRTLVGDKTRITNRLCSTLKEYFPQALDWFEHRDTVLFCDFCSAGPASSMSSEHGKRRYERSSARIACAAPSSSKSAFAASAPPVRLPTMGRSSARINCSCRRSFRSCA